MNTFTSLILLFLVWRGEHICRAAKQPAPNTVNTVYWQEERKHIQRGEHELTISDHLAKQGH